VTGRIIISRKLGNHLKWIALFDGERRRG